MITFDHGVVVNHAILHYCGVRTDGKDIGRGHAQTHVHQTCQRYSQQINVETLVSCVILIIMGELVYIY